VSCGKCGIVESRAADSERVIRSGIDASGGTSFWSVSRRIARLVLMLRSSYKQAARRTTARQLGERLFDIQRAAEAPPIGTWRDAAAPCIRMLLPRRPVLTPPGKARQLLDDLRNA